MWQCNTKIYLDAEKYGKAVQEAHNSAVGTAKLQAQSFAFIQLLLYVPYFSKRSIDVASPTKPIHPSLFLWW
jgi:hypothetical protein